MTFLLEVAGSCPRFFHFRKQAKPQMVKGDLNKGFPGLASIQSQIYNPAFGRLKKTAKERTEGEMDDHDEHQLFCWLIKSSC